MSNYLLLSQMPKELLPYLLDSEPKLKIHYVEFDNCMIIVNGKISYLNHQFPISVTVASTSKFEKYERLCNSIDNLIWCLKKKVGMSIKLIQNNEFQHTFSDTYISDSEVSIGEDYIQIGKYNFSIDCASAIITFLESTKTYALMTKEYEYLIAIYDIYKQYYPENWLCKKSLQGVNYDMCVENILNQKMFYGYNKFDLDKYEVMCQSGDYADYLPIFYCDETCPINMENKNQVIVALDMNSMRAYNIENDSAKCYIYPKN